MASLEHVDLLRHVPPFDGLGERHLHAIGDACATVTLAPGTVLTRRGAAPDALHVILRGQARIVGDAAPGMPVVIDDIGRGGHAGEAAIDAGPAPFSVTCVTEVEALALRAAALRALRGQWPDIDTALRDRAARRDDVHDAGDGGGDADAPGGAGPAGAGDAAARREAASDRREPQASRPIGDGPVAWHAGATVPGRRPRRLPLMRQRYASDAGPACLATVARHYGRRVGLNAARERAGSGRSPSALPALERAAQGLGFETRAGVASYDQLARAPLPAIAGWAGGHWVVVSAIEGGRVTMGDPAGGTRRVTADVFQAGWTGEALYLGPTARLLELPPRGQARARAVAYLVPTRRVLGELVLASVLVQVLALTVPVFARFVIDDVIARQDRSWLWPALAGMGAALALAALAALARRHLLEFVSRQFDARLADDVYRHLLALPARFFEGRHAGETVRHFEETSTVTSFLAGTGAGFLIDMGTAALAVALMVHYDPRLAALAVAVVALEVGQLFVAARRLGQGVTGTFRTEVDREGLLLESFSGLSTIKALAIEHFTRWKLEGRLIAQINASFDTLRYRALSILGSQTLGHLGPVAVLFTGALLVLRGELTAGVLVAVVLLARMVSAPFSALVASWGALQDTAAAFDEIADILDTTPESPESPVDRVELQRLHGHVRFEGVSFRYDDDGPDTLHDVTFECYGGQRIAIVGPSGSGKTTLLKLLLG
ncbi:MAG: ABC transporter transmembrane domain-containing protein, partial [Vicinamibacterales bacterium]|nr:ABC transporter transmembrane domain-containing protein [Vicinamibacterales bacterium]